MAKALDSKSDQRTVEVEPWTKWKHEMPKCNDEVDCPDYELLNSHSHLRKMLGEVRERVFEMAAQTFKHCQNGAIVLQGGKSSDFEFYDTDTLYCNFRQEPFFRYLFGLNEPDVMGILDLERKEIVLLVAPVPLSAERWMGKRRSFEYYQKEYAADDCTAVSDIDSVLSKRGIEYLYILDGVNTDSDLRTKTIASFDGMDKYWIDRCDLFHLLSDARAIKTTAEIELMRVACRVSSKAHIYVMRHIQPKMTERQLEALFKGYSYFYGGARHQSYECICGSGPNQAVLHYGHSGYPNDRVLRSSDTVLLDMGSEYMGYATDITCSFPVNGVFTSDQRAVHTAVFEAQKAVADAVKPGVKWTDMHRLAERQIVRNLIKMGILVCKDCNYNSIEEATDALMRLNFGAMFMPHGLGHLIGITVHDVGGFENSAPSEELGLCWLRTTRVLKAGMVITIEPGLYFNQSWIQQMIANYPIMDKYIDWKVLSRFLDTGGCRLEDDVLITDTGMENLTLCPRSCEEIEKVMKVAKSAKL